MDAVPFSGEDVTIYHNKYPLLYAKAGEEARDELGEVGAQLFTFMRSSSTVSPQHTQMFWLGD